MTRYAIVARTDWHAAGCPDPWRMEQATVVPDSLLRRETVAALGRDPLAHDSVRRRLDRYGRVFLAASRGYGKGGLIVGKVPNNTRAAGKYLED